MQLSGVAQAQHAFDRRWIITSRKKGSSEVSKNRFDRGELKPTIDGLEIDCDIASDRPGYGCKYVPIRESVGGLGFQNREANALCQPCISLASGPTEP